jgi:hypothetical protein
LDSNNTKAVKDSKDSESEWEWDYEELGPRYDPDSKADLEHTGIAGGGCAYSRALWKWHAERDRRDKA